MIIVKSFIISGDKHFINRAVEHADSLHGVISIVRTSDTAALIKYDAGLTNLSNLNHVLNKYRVTQQESKK